MKDRGLSQFAEVGGYDPKRDPSLDQPKKIFKVLTKRLHSQQQGRVPYDPKVTGEALKAACKKDFNHLVL